MSNISSQVVRAICADYFSAEHVRICGSIGTLRTDVVWHAFTLNGFIKIDPYVKLDKIYFVAYKRGNEVIVYKYK